MSEIIPLRLNGVCVELAGRKALDDITLELSKGRITAIVGSEDAGKSVLLHTAAGLITPDTGTVEVLGNEEKNGQSGIGVALFPRGFYPSWTGEVHLKYAASISGNFDATRISWVSSRTGLSTRINERVSTYSRSSRAALALAMSLVSGPELLLLDEPFIALDVERQTETARLLRGLTRSVNLSVLFATRSLGDAIKYADRILVLDGARLIFDGPKSQVAAAGEDTCVIFEDAERAAEDLVRVRGITPELSASDTLRFAAGSDVSELTGWLISRGHKLTGLITKEMSLDELIGRIMNGSMPDAPATLEDVDDVLDLLDDGDSDLSEFMNQP